MLDAALRAADTGRAMSQENVELVRLGFEAYQQGNWELVQENSHPDLLIVQPPEVPDAKTYRGPHAFADAATDWPSQWEDFQMELVELIDVDDERVISVTRHHGRGAESGIEMDFTVAYLLTLRDSKLARLDMFFSRAQALEAVGLREQAMSQEDVEVVRRWLALWDGVDVVAVFRDDATWTRTSAEIEGRFRVRLCGRLDRTGAACN